MLSAMTPTIVLSQDGSVRMVTGTPGGSTIITTVLQTISNVLDFGMGLVEAVNAPRSVLTGWADPRRGGLAAGC